MEVQLKKLKKLAAFLFFDFDGIVGVSWQETLILMFSQSLICDHDLVAKSKNVLTSAASRKRMTIHKNCKKVLEPRTDVAS